MEITPLVKSIEPVLINERTGQSDYIYFVNTKRVEDSAQYFKDQFGCVTFTIGFYTKNEDGKFIEIPGISPHKAQYKLSTFMTLFGTFSFNEFQATKADIMIQEINANSVNYWGLTSDKLETYVG